jgi:hypothetical protein
MLAFVSLLILIMVFLFFCVFLKKKSPPHLCQAVPTEHTKSIISSLQGNLNIKTYEKWYSLRDTDIEAHGGPWSARRLKPLVLTRDH